MFSRIHLKIKKNYFPKLKKTKHLPIKGKMLFYENKTYDISLNRKLVSKLEYIIKVENFEGPFELLLDLIKKREMDIHDLQISQITNDFISSLQEMKKQEIEITSNFMEMASMLLEIKSKMLLPVEKEKNDPRKELVQQLLDYKEYKESIGKLQELKESERKLLKRQRIEKVRIEKKGNLFDIFKAYQNIMSKKFNDKNETPLDKLTEELSRFNYTIEERMEFLKEMLKKSDMNVIEYFNSVEEKEKLITTFGALLELIKIQYIDIIINEKTVIIKERKVVD